MRTQTQIYEYKDKVLQKAYGHSSANASAIDGDSEAIQSAIMALHDEGLVKVINKGNNCGKIAVINYEITEMGTTLVDNGGYAKRNRILKCAKMRATLWRAAQFVLAAIVGGVIAQLLQRLFHIWNL